LALLASDATKGKGGRPRKTVARPAKELEEGEANGE
jgi:hypothetical protein